MAKDIQAIIFDFDGTLINSVDVLLEMFLEDGRKFGGTVTKEDFIRLNGLRVMTGVKILIREKKLKRLAVARMILRARKARRKVMEETTIYPHVDECLSDLKGRYRIAMATSGDRGHVGHFMQKYDLRQYFEHIVTKEDVSQRKPNPEPYLKAAAHLGIDPAHCLAVEDSPNGLRAAKAAGLQTCVVLHFTPKSWFTGDLVPDHFVDNLAQLYQEVLSP